MFESQTSFQTGIQKHICTSWLVQSSDYRGKSTQSWSLTLPGSLVANLPSLQIFSKMLFSSNTILYLHDYTFPSCLKIAIPASAYPGKSGTYSFHHHPRLLVRGFQDQDCLVGSAILWPKVSFFSSLLFCSSLAHITRAHSLSPAASSFKNVFWKILNQSIPLSCALTITFSWRLMRKDLVAQPPVPQLDLAMRSIEIYCTGSEVLSRQGQKQELGVSYLSSCCCNGMIPAF